MKNIKMTEINYWDTWEVAREKINNILDIAESSIPSIWEDNHRYLGWVDTGINATWPQWEEWQPWPTWNWIDYTSSDKVGKTTTVTLHYTNWESDSFEVQDWADWWGWWGGGWDGNVVGPDSSTDWNISVFDWTDGKHIKDWWKKISDLVQTSGNQTINGVKTFWNEPILPSKTLDATNDWTKPATEAQVYKKQDTLTPGNNIIIEENIISATVPTQASDVGALPDSTKYWASLSLSINSSTYVITATLKDQNGNTLGSSQTIDLPLESVVVSGSYDDETKEVILVLEWGSEIKFSVADLVAWLQSEITNENKLDADLVDDTNSTNKFTNETEKTAWNWKLDSSAISDVNYWWAWNGDTNHAPSKNAIYTKLHTMDVEIWNKAADNNVVKLSGNQTINGTKTFWTSPVVPSKTTDATNTWTAIATEAQVYKKQDSLEAQTPYANKGNWKKVPQISTNNLGQVTSITEVNIEAGEYTAWTGIAILKYNDYSAMQWPCPDWYHIPSREENAAIVDAMTALGINTATWACMKTYLKMPYAWYRNQTNGNTGAQGTGWRYWSYLRLNTNAASILSFQSNGLGNSNANAAYGMSIRPFKDEAVIPDNTWTMLFDWSLIATNAWIFHNATDGIISISADWTTWITIADKNLWATVVYNDGDTLSESNAGWYFQHWNNYMFPFTWSVTTSSTKVDTTDYWPWNYYSSSTFIAVSWDWSSVYNSNLWWGDTWVVVHDNVITNTWVVADWTTPTTGSYTLKCVNGVVSWVQDNI